LGSVLIDPATGHVFAATGNALTNPESFRYCEDVVELSSRHELPRIYGGDVDFGATPILYQPPGCPAQVAAKNKTGVLIVYDRGDVLANSSFDATSGTQLWSSGSTIGAAIYGASIVVNGRVFVGAWDGKLHAFGLYRRATQAFQSRIVGKMGCCFFVSWRDRNASFVREGDLPYGDALQERVPMAGTGSIVSHHTRSRSLGFELVGHLLDLRACSFGFAARPSISFCFSPTAISCLGTVDLSCEKVASVIRPNGL
jgi:hypothetical protein